MIWNIADPQTTKMNNPRRIGPTGYFSSCGLRDLGTFPLVVTFWLCFSLATRIRCLAGIFEDFLIVIKLLQDQVQPNHNKAKLKRKRRNESHSMWRKIPNALFDWCWFITWYESWVNTACFLPAQTYYDFLQILFFDFRLVIKIVV